jgi:curli biogenesis system outer membrane secretion channel CsgG
MKFRRSSLSAVVAGALLFFCTGTHSHSQESTPKKRIAVLNFDNPRVGTDAPKGLFGVDGEDVGKGVSVQIIQKLVEGGRYAIVDRSSLEELLKEQKQSDRNELDAYGMAAKIGRLLGLDAMIIGAITRYAPDEKDQSEGGVPFPGMHARKARATVGITARVFNVGTGEVMASFTGEGESMHTGEVLILGVRGHGKGSQEMLGSEFAESLFPEATRSAVERITGQLNAFADKIPALTVTIEGLVADVEGNTLTLSLGKRSDVKVGDRLKIVRNAAGKGNSESAKAVPVAAEPIGIATVTEVAEDYVTATFSGPGHAQVGDRINGVDKESALPH